jgi:hypothetical protein
MVRTTPSSASSGSPEQLELAAFDCLQMLEAERAISGDLIDESERLITRIVHAIDASPADRLPSEVRVWRERYRAHLTALRAYVGGGFHFETEES